MVGRWWWKNTLHVVHTEKFRRLKMMGEMKKKRVCVCVCVGVREREGKRNRERERKRWVESTNEEER